MQGAAFAFNFLSSVVRRHLPSVFLTGHTGELHGECVREIMCLFSRSPVTSAVPVQASAELGYRGKLFLGQAPWVYLTVSELCEFTDAHRLLLIFTQLTKGTGQ